MNLPEIGELNRRISIYQIGTNPDAGSGYEETRTKRFDLWAKVEIIGGVNYWGAIQADDAITHRFTIRRQAGARPEDFTRLTRILHEGTWYVVKRATDINAAHRFTALECEAQYGESA